MAGITRKVHMQSNYAFDSIDSFAPYLGIRQPPDGNGGEPVAPKALAFTDPDGETHVYVFSEEGRQGLIRALTGGIEIAKPGSMPK
jgi:hypothetical protein